MINRREFVKLGSSALSSMWLAGDARALANPGGDPQGSGCLCRRRKSPDQCSVAQAHDRSIAQRGSGGFPASHRSGRDVEANHLPCF